MVLKIGNGNEILVIFLGTHVKVYVHACLSPKISFFLTKYISFITDWKSGIGGMKIYNEKHISIDWVSHFHSLKTYYFLWKTTL